MPDGALWALMVALAYLVGAIPFGYFIGRSRGVDIRQHGSGNIGATNVRRVLGSGAGNLCLALDILKGAGPVLLAGGVMGTLGAHTLSGATAWAWLAVALATVVGHMFPIYLKFRGGKGVATGLGALSALWPVVTPAAALALVVWIVALRTTRYVSLASCAAALSLPAGIALVRALGWGRAEGVALFEHTIGSWPFMTLTGILAALVLYRHRGNLQRIARGEEPRVGARANAST